MARRRPTRTTLRGWTRGLPPLAACFGLMFLFVWLEGQLVRNNTRANDLILQILKVKASIAKLEEQNHHLKRMERMEQEAPSLALTEVSPGQIVTIRGGPRRETAVPTNSEFAERGLALPTRSVVIHLGPSDGVNADTTLQHEVARLDSVQGPPL